MFPGAMHGKVSPYWNVPHFPHMRPLANIYGNPWMTPFNATMVPVAPYAVPTYMPVPPMFGSLPAYKWVECCFFFMFTFFLDCCMSLACYEIVLH